MSTIRDLSDNDLRLMVEQGLPLADYVAEVERRAHRARHDLLVKNMVLETQNAILRARVDVLTAHLDLMKGKAPEAGGRA